MFEFSKLSRVVFHTVDSLQDLANEMDTPSSAELDAIFNELVETNQALEETIEQSPVSEAARKAILGLQKDLRAEVIRQISKQLLTNIPLLQIQVGGAQAQQNIFSKELKKFEERLNYVLEFLKKSRGGQASPVDLDTTQ